MSNKEHCLRVSACLGSTAILQGLHHDKYFSKCKKHHICLMSSQSTTCRHTICMSGYAKPNEDFLARHQ